MDFNKLTPRQLLRLIKVYSAIKNFELPVLGITTMALIPGLLDETIVGIIGAGAFLVIKVLHRKLIRNKNKIIKRLSNSENKGKLSEEELSEAIKIMKNITLAGGS